MNEPGWELRQDTGEPWSLRDKCHGIFDDLSEDLSVTSHPMDGISCITVFPSLHWATGADIWPEGRLTPADHDQDYSLQQLSFPSRSPSTNQAHICLTSVIPEAEYPLVWLLHSIGQKGIAPRLSMQKNSNSCMHVTEKLKTKWAGPCTPLRRRWIHV